MPAPQTSHLGIGIVAVAGLCALTFACAVMAALAAAVVGGQSAASGTPVADIPPEYLAAYRSAAERFHLGDDGWSYLAAIGKIESDHGRSTAPGVHSGQNTHGCCAGPMQIHNGFGAGTATWGAYKFDGDGDDRLDIYDPDDAIATAARYLREAGAPANWRVALYAYNHATWYVDQVNEQAAEYRRLEGTPSAPAAPDGWLTGVPGFPGERCDARIVADVLTLTRAYRLTLTDCFGGLPHATAGEHPLGLATDLVPSDGNWQRTERLACDAGWTPTCASSGCAGRGPFRVVLYNGFPGHGDPQHTDRPHLHLSWQHGPAAPFTRAPWVRAVLAHGGATP